MEQLHSCTTTSLGTVTSNRTCLQWQLPVRVSMDMTVF